MTTPTITTTEGERSLHRWQYAVQSGFECLLWKLISCADSTNLSKLEQGFPEHVAAYRQYIHTPGYWDALKERMVG
jgi:hypothetical protein